MQEADHQGRSASDIFALLERGRESSSSGSDDGLKRRYLQAAAVLSSIRQVDSLEPVGRGGKREEAFRLLRSELIPASGRKFDGEWMLHPDARRAGISELQSVEERAQALRANPTERTSSLQNQLEKYLLKAARPLSEQPLNEVESTLQVVTWLSGVLEGLPPLAEVQARLNELSLLSGFESIAGDEIFRGRRAELDQIRSYIGVMAPEALLRRLADRAFKWIRPDAMPALSIFGPGGVGKSALVARFILEHSRVTSDARVPFAYLDCERPSLNIGDPRTLLREMLRQIDLQFSKEGHFQKLREFFETMEQKEQGRDNPGLIPNVIADLVGGIENTIGPRPYVIVLDSFEEVQYRDEKHAFPFWELLGQMQKRWPFLRVIVAGRAPVTSLQLASRPPIEIALSGLDRDAAIAFTQNQGVADLATAEALVKHVGGIPLSLKLAASVMKQDQNQSTESLPGRSRFWFSANTEVIQGQLYSRILGHIHDPVVQKLAHPGLVLRRVSPPLILNVLNEPCRLGLTTLEEATEIFDRFRDETSLVVVDSLDGSVIHRTDLRRTMLKLLLEASPALAESIHQGAVQYYQEHREPIGWRATAEEFYHRLFLDEDQYRHLKFDDPEVRSSLQKSIVELPLKSQRFLATRGFQVAMEVLETATRDEVEASIAAQVEDLLPRGPNAVAYAENLIKDAADYTDHAGPLFRAAARVAAQQERFSDSFQFIENGLGWALRESLGLEALNLLSEKAWVLRRHSEFGDLLSSLEQLGEFAQRFDRPLLLLQHHIQSWELGELPPDQVRAPSNSNLRAIGELIGRLSPEDVWKIFPLLENIAPALANQEPGGFDSVLLLIVSEKSPFRRVEIEQVTDVIAVLADLGFQFGKQDPELRAVAAGHIHRLCSVWPFQVLRVRPPYSSSTFASETVA